jgi:hypothetical protein
METTPEEKKIKAVDQYEELMNQYIGNPTMLAKLNIRIAGAASYYLGQLEPILAQKPEVWIRIKESGETKDISDKKAEMLWQMTEIGKLERSYSTNLKRLDIMQKAISKLLFELKNERERTKIS